MIFYTFLWPCIYYILIVTLHTVRRARALLRVCVSVILSECRCVSFIVIKRVLFLVGFEFHGYFYFPSASDLNGLFGGFFLELWALEVYERETGGCPSQATCPGCESELEAAGAEA